MANPGDTLDAARAYLRAETGNFHQPEAIEAFLEAGPQMLDWFEAETSVRFVPTLYPDYHPTVEGGVDVGRSVLAAPYDSSALAKDLPRLRPPLATITFMGMMFNSSNADIKHFFNATKSARSFAYVARRLAAHAAEVARHGRGVQVTSGNALAARLAKSCFDLGIPILTDTPALRLLQENGRVTGAETGGSDPGAIIAARGVVLACGGYAQDLARRAGVYAHLRAGGAHFSPVPSGNTGDGIRLGEAAGGAFDAEYPQPAAWMPVSRVPGKGLFPHLLDRYKPGMIAVLSDGQRFVNESESYHDVGAAMAEAGEGGAWLVCDHRAIRKYGLGHAKPAPMPLRPWIRSGYLKTGQTLPIWRAPAGSTLPGLRTPFPPITASPARAGTTSFTGAKPASTAIWPIPITRPIPASRRSTRVPSTPCGWRWAIWAPSTG